MGEGVWNMVKKLTAWQKEIMDVLVGLIKENPEFREILQKMADKEIASQKAQRLKPVLN